MIGVRIAGRTGLHAALAWRRLGAAALLLVAFAGPATFAAEAVRPEVGKPLQAAQELVRSGKFRDALKRVADAERVGSPSAYESYLIEHMRLAAASGAGDLASAGRAYQAIEGSSRLTTAEKQRMLESLAGMAYRGKDYAQTMQWGERYVRAGGNSAGMRTLLIQARYLAGDFGGAARELLDEIKTAEQAGRAPAEERLTLLLNAAQRQDDADLAAWTIERLVVHHPKKAYWADLLGRLQRQPEFSGRLELDVYRLSLATGALDKPGDFMEMAQLAVQAGFPAEAKAVLEKGHAAGVLGKGAQAARQQRLRDLVETRLAAHRAGLAAREAGAKQAGDGEALVEVGYSLVVDGQTKKGLELMQQGMGQGGLKRPEDARLHLGIALAMAGQTAQAQATLRGVRGQDGTAQLARLWALHVRQ